ncbi:MAG TPA: EAL domain-containing protein [Longimicrobiaceae bacterium]
MELFVARQPIFDAAGELHGYELLYRGGAQSSSADGTSTEQMSLDVIVQSFLEIGLDRITRGHTAYLNFSRQMLLSGSYDLLDPETVIVELLEDVLGDEPVARACAHLAQAGYQLALDDYEPGGPHEALLPHARIVKVDVLNRPMEELRAVADRLRGQPVRLLAERVETAEVRDACREIGFELFQGYFFARPEVISGQGISADQLAILQLMNRLRDDGTSDIEIEETFRRDPSLSYKLLRMVNAAAGGGRGIESIMHAIRLLGREQLHRWLALLFASSLARGKATDVELVHAAVLRGRLLERLGEAAGKREQAGSLFMVGLFSLMDALLRMPMAELLERVDLAEEVKTALLKRDGPYAVWLQLAESYEAAEWERMTALAASVAISPFELPDIYLESLNWARDRVPVTAG